MTVTNQECKKTACKECPFKRTSAPGWLGAASFDDDPASSFLDPHWIGEMPLPCHMQVKWEADDSQEQAQTAPMCFGYLTMMKNNCKSPRDPALAAMVRDMEMNTTDYFMHPNEFKEHHNNGLKNAEPMDDPEPAEMTYSMFGEPKPASSKQITDALDQLELTVGDGTFVYLYDSTNEPEDSIFHGWTAEVMALDPIFGDPDEIEEVVLHTAGFRTKEKLVAALAQNGVMEHRMEVMEG